MRRCACHSHHTSAAIPLFWERPISHSSANGPNLFWATACANFSRDGVGVFGLGVFFGKGGERIERIPCVSSTRELLSDYELCFKTDITWGGGGEGERDKVDNHWAPGLERSGRKKKKLSWLKSPAGLNSAGSPKTVLAGVVVVVVVNLATSGSQTVGGERGEGALYQTATLTPPERFPL